MGLPEDNRQELAANLLDSLEPPPGISIDDKNETRVLDAADSPQLTLITCYPFDAVAPGTSMRYVVVAEKV